VVNAATEALKAHTASTHGDVKDAAAPRSTVAPTEDRRIPGSTTAAPDERRDIPPSDIFISYEHRDRDKARMLANALAAEGWTVWWDRKIAPGEAFDLVIERELASCKCVIVLWTARSVGATWVRNEARRAAKRRVLVPILMGAVEPPLEFENLQAADLTSWVVNAEHPEFDAVLDKIQGLAPRRVPLLNTLRAAAADRVERENVEAPPQETEAAERPAAQVVEGGETPITLFLRPEALYQPEEQLPGGCLIPRSNHTHRSGLPSTREGFKRRLRQAWR
jgi:hypothetical protein